MELPEGEVIASKLVGSLDIQQTTVFCSTLYSLLLRITLQRDTEIYLHSYTREVEQAERL